MSARTRNLNARIKQLLKELKSSLSKAFSESNDVHRVLQRVRQEGWSLYLVVDRKGEDEEPEAFELSAPKRRRASEPKFRIDGRDLSFLKSVGIDPTRTLRRRRS